MFGNLHKIRFEGKIISYILDTYFNLMNIFFMW